MVNFATPLREADVAADEQICLTSYRIYETAIRYYIVGATQDEQRYAVLKVDRTVHEAQFAIEEDETLYTKKQINELLAAIDDGNRACGGLRRLASACGIIGMIRFTANYYFWLITKRSIVAQLGGHYVYHIEDTKLLSLTPSGSPPKPARSADEARYQSILNSLEINKTFYFSNTYDITHTLQYNLTTPPTQSHAFLGRFQEMFVWNHFLLDTAFGRLKGHARWCVPIVHGFIDQAKITVLGRPIYLTIIARRSRHFAGARFLKRGANQDGYVANDVETEQIVTDASTTSFRRADGRLNKSFSSFVQHRGSIPLHWSQTVDGVNPKPPIELNVVDPYFRAAALHFNNMFERYGTPVFVINLIKTRERTARETILGKEFTESIAYLNQSLPPEHRLRYSAWDMSRASKSPDQEVISTLEKIANDTLSSTGFFRSDPDTIHLQSGVARTNCIDCLDRTNAAQFVIGKLALAMQLHSLGILADPADLMYDCDCVSMLIEMYHDHGDTIALQYGGSHLVNTMETYRKINQWSSHSRDMLESIRRFYNNSFLDAQRQEAINLFLGYFDVSADSGTQRDGKELNLWDLENDERLHHDLGATLQPRPHYRRWFRAKMVADCGKHELDASAVQNRSDRLTLADSRYWDEYYKPKVLSTVNKIFAYGINSTALFSRRISAPAESSAAQDRLLEFDVDPSPFTVRVSASHNEEQIARNAVDACGGTQAASDSPGKSLQAAGQAMVSSLSLVSRDPSNESIDSKSIVSKKTSRNSRYDLSPVRRDVPDTPLPDRKISIHRWLGNVTGRHTSDARHASQAERRSSVTLTPQQSARIASFGSQVKLPLAQRVEQVCFTTEPLSSSSQHYRRHVSAARPESSTFTVPRHVRTAWQADQRTEAEMQHFVAKLLSPPPMSSSTTRTLVSSIASTAVPTPAETSDVEGDSLKDLVTYNRFVEMAPRMSNLPPPMHSNVQTSATPRNASDRPSPATKQKLTRSESSGVFRLSHAAKQLWRGRHSTHDSSGNTSADKLSARSPVKAPSSSSKADASPTASPQLSAAKKWRKRARTLASAKRRSRYQTDGPENGTIEEETEEDVHSTSPTMTTRVTPSPESMRIGTKSPYIDAGTSTSTVRPVAERIRTSFDSVHVTEQGRIDDTTAAYTTLIGELLSIDNTLQSSTTDALTASYKDELATSWAPQDASKLGRSITLTEATGIDLDDLRIYEEAAALAA